MCHHSFAIIRLVLLFSGFGFMEAFLTRVVGFCGYIPTLDATGIDSRYRGLSPTKDPSHLVGLYTVGCNRQSIVGVENYSNRFWCSLSPLGHSFLGLCECCHW